MSTSLFYHACGIRNVVYQKTEYKGGRLIFHVTPSTKAIRCGIGFSERVTLKGRIERIFRTLPHGQGLDRVFNSSCVLQGLWQYTPNLHPPCLPRQTYTRSFERYALGL